jgi:hypothetical protein
MSFGATIQFVWEKALVKQLQKRVAKLQKNKNRIMVESTRSGMRIVASAIKRGMPAYTPNAAESESDYKETRAAVGSRAGVSGAGKGANGPRGTVFGKAGSKVGKKRQDPKSLSGNGRSRPGVGTGVASLHWYLAGTGDRFTRTGIHTGRMRRLTVVQEAWAASRGLAYNRIRTRLWTKIKREAARP